jgi:hypothetical protein
MLYRIGSNALLTGGVLALGLAASPVAQADVLMVTNTNDSGPGSLRQCIEDALPGDEIQFDRSLDGQVIRGTPYDIDKDLTITGRGPDKTVMAGRISFPWGGTRVLRILASATVSISGVTLRSGYGTCDGGGAFRNLGTLTISNSFIRDHLAYCEHSTRSPGGAAIRNLGELTISDCTISHNRFWVEGLGRGSGGAIKNQGNLVVVNSEISHNRAPGGGAISNGHSGSTLTVTSSTISNNLAEDGWGGGISNNRGSVTVNECTISDNWAPDGWGGGIANDEGTVTVSSSTISGNSARWGGGIYNGEDGESTISNSIIANQTNGTDCSGVGGSSVGHNLDSDGSCGFDHPTDQPNKNPELGPLQDNGGPTWTHVPLKGSPVIDKGMCDPGVDQRGVPRPLDGDRDGVWLCDIGAVEYVPYEFEVVGPGGGVIVFPPDGE